MMRFKKLFYIKILVTLISMGGAFFYVDMGRFLDQIALIPWYVAVLSIGLFAGQVFFATRRWGSILRTYKRVPFHRVLEINVFSILLQNIFLGSIGASILKIGLTKRLQIPISVATLSFLLDRIIIVGVLAASILCVLPFRYDQALYVDIRYLALGFFLCCGVLYFSLKFFMDRGLKNRFRKYKRYFQKIRDHFISSLWKAVGFSVISLLLYFMGIYALSRALNMPLSFWDISCVFPLVAFVTSLPISINGWGVREASVIVALRSFGIASEDALALSLLIGFISLLSLLPLLVPSLFYRNQAFFKKTRAISLGGDFE